MRCHSIISLISNWLNFLLDPPLLGQVEYFHNTNIDNFSNVLYLMGPGLVDLGLVGLVLVGLHLVDLVLMGPGLVDLVLVGLGLMDLYSTRG